MKMFINGIPTDAADGKTIDVINPATGAVVDTVPAATKEDVDAAVDYAKKAKNHEFDWHISHHTSFCKSTSHLRRRF